MSRTVAYTYEKRCEYCKKPFKASRRDARYCSDACGANARLEKRRERKRQARLDALGGACRTCGSAKALFIRADETLSCGRCLSKESQSKFHKRWPKGKRGYVRRQQNRKWEQEYLDMLPAEERERFLAQFE